MEQEVLRRVQLTQLEMLKEVKRICLKHGIRYWLEGGTLLGAVRHGGFIPWDDDLDVAMLREDYDRFLEVAQAELGGRYFLETWHNTDEYALPFAKIRKNGTVYRECVSQRAALNGIFIDIFPYDVFPVEPRQIYAQSKKIQLLKAMLQLKSGYRPWLSAKGFDRRVFAAYLPKMALSIFCSRRFAKRQFDRLHERYNGAEEFAYYVVADITKYGRWKMRREIVESLSEIRFEDDVFACPADYDAYLTQGYGDYMTPPPEEQRAIGHSVLEVDFGE